MSIKPDKINFQSCNLSIYPALGQVRTAGNTIRLSPLNMKLLTVLLENANQVVSRKELFDQVWRNQLVSEDTLTRCISDIRSQLGKNTNQQVLIETLPKRGYRWVPKVSLLDHDEHEALPLSEEGKGWPWYLLNGLKGLIGLFILTLVVLWYSGQFDRSEATVVAILPIVANQQDIEIVADELEDILVQQLLLYEQIGFLSTNAVAEFLNSPYPALSREFGAQWAIEGRVRSNQSKLRVSLSLVDALTATVVYTQNTDVENDSVELENLSAEFVAKLLDTTTRGRSGE